MSLFGNAHIDRLTTEIAGLKAEIKKLTAERNALGEVVKHTERIAELRKQVNDLEIDKAKKQEDFDRRERELTHMIGLEKKRQEVEIAQAKKETELTVREGNLKAERDEFEKRMKFREETFDGQTKRLETILAQVLDRLPTVTVDRQIKETTTSRR